MNLKTTNRIAIEKASQCFKNKNLILSGTPEDINHKTLTFLEVFGSTNKFFYLAEKRQNGIVSLRERGIGHVEIIDDQPCLIRSEPLGYYIAGDPNAFPCVNGPIDLIGDVVVSSSYPFNLQETLCIEHSVPACDFPFMPKNVQISPYSLLGRMDGDIVSISVNDLADDKVISEALTRAVTGYTKQIALSATKLNMKNKRGVISSNIFHLNPTSNPPAKKGTLIYDEASDKLKYYDGANWRTIKYELDQ